MYAEQRRLGFGTVSPQLGIELPHSQCAVLSNHRLSSQDRRLQVAGTHQPALLLSKNFI